MRAYRTTSTLLHVMTIAALCGLFLSSCRDTSVSPLTLHSPDFKTPVVTGLNLTSSSPAINGVWRSPSDKLYVHVSGTSTDTSQVFHIAVPSTEGLYCSYPNPTDGSAMISFSLPSTSSVTCWIVPAKLPEQSGGSDVQEYGGSTLPAPEGYAVSVPLYNRQMAPGMYTLQWNTTGFSAGFYRIYLQINDNDIYWNDVLLFHAVSDLPIGLR